MQTKLMNFQIFSSKEKHLIYKGPDNPPQPIEAKEGKLSKEAQEALKAGDQMHDFLIKKGKDLIRICKKDEENPDDTERGKLETEGYEIKIYIGKNRPGGGDIVVKKGGKILSLSVENKGIYILDYNIGEKRVMTNSRANSYEGDQALLKQKFDQFYGILKRALEKSDKEVKDF